MFQEENANRAERVFGDAGRRRARALSWFAVAGLAMMIASGLAPGSAGARSTGAKGRVLWSSSYQIGKNGFGKGRAVAVSPNGKRVYITGETRGGRTGYASFTAAYSAMTGAQIWARRFQPRSDSVAWGWAIVVSPGGGKVFVTGTSTIAYSAATGKRLWTRRFDHPDLGQVVVASPNSKRVYVGADTYGAGYETIAYDAASGVRLWQAHYGGSDSSLKSVVVSPDGQTVVVAGSDGAVAYRAATGSQLWTANPSSAGASLAFSPSGGQVFVAGGSATVAYNASTGTQEWAAQYSSSSDAAAVVATASRVYVGTETEVGSGKGVEVTRSYDASTGTRQWTARSTTGEPVLALSPDGSAIYVLGVNYGVIAYSGATGDRLWSAHPVTAMANSDPTAIATTSAGGEVVVTGTSFGPRGPRAESATTIAYVP